MKNTYTPEAEIDTSQRQAWEIEYYANFFLDRIKVSHCWVTFSNNTFVIPEKISIPKNDIFVDTIESYLKLFDKNDLRNNTIQSKVEFLILNFIEASKNNYRIEHQNLDTIKSNTRGKITATFFERLENDASQEFIKNHMNTLSQDIHFSLIDKDTIYLTYNYLSPNYWSDNKISSLETAENNKIYSWCIKLKEIFNKKIIVSSDLLHTTNFSGQESIRKLLDEKNIQSTWSLALKNRNHVYQKNLPKYIQKKWRKRWPRQRRDSNKDLVNIDKLSNSIKKTYLLVQSCIKWDRAAQNLLFKTHKPIAKLVCSKYISDHTSAEEKSIEVMAKCFEKLEYYKPIYSFNTRLSALAKNLVIDSLRKKELDTTSLDNVITHNESTRFSDIISDTENNIDRNTENEWKKAIYNDSKNMLDYKHWSSLELVYTHQLDYYWIAKILNFPLWTAKWRIFRAKEMLAETISRRTKNTKLIEQN